MFFLIRSDELLVNLQEFPYVQIAFGSDQLPSAGCLAAPTFRCLNDIEGNPQFQEIIRGVKS